jgi:uncharacterized protein (TIGR01777 family)
LETTDAVVNLAGSSLAGTNPLTMRWTAARKKNIQDSRIWAGNQLSETIALSPTKPEVLVQASAIGFYGNIGEGPVNENSPPGDDFLAQVSLGWEPSTKSVEAEGVRRVIIRIGLVLGQGSDLLTLLKLPFILFVGGRIGTGEQFFSWIHIDDLVASIIFLVENHRAQGAYNLTAPNPVKNKTFAQVLGHQLKRPVWLPIPPFALKIALGEAATMALDGRPVFPKRLFDLGYKFQYDKLDAALKDLLWV